jgi:hypothetical protein
VAAIDKTEDKDTLMTQQPPGRESGDQDIGYDREPRPGIPRWAKIAAIVAAVVALLIVAMMLVGGGHSPRRHGPPVEDTPATAGGGHVPSPGVHG